MRLTSMRRFRSDPLLVDYPHGATAARRLEHPVLDLVGRRADSCSKPGARNDQRRIALVIEGGGMRGAVSAGMCAALEQLGLTDSFDALHGASAGAFNAAFMLAGQAGYLTALYPHGFGNPKFATYLRALIGRPPFDLDYVVDRVWLDERPLRTDRIIESRAELHCAATDVSTADPVDLTDLRSDTEIRAALRASSRLPLVAGAPVEFRGRRLLDATLAEAMPIASASSHTTDLLVLQTRPQGVDHTPLTGRVAKLTDRYLERLNPALAELQRTRSQRYDELTANLASRSADPAARPRVCVIRPALGTPVVRQLENSPAALVAAGGDGFRAAWTALTGEVPELTRPLRASGEM